jgi:GntR family transcriptional regulator
MQLDRSSPTPLWSQLEQDLERRLSAGEFDSRFPTDHELVDHYGVSRHTVREAIRHLNRAGILRRERGRGTVVDRSVFEQPLGVLYSLFASIEATGAEQRSDVRLIGEEVDAAVARRLEVEPHARLFVLERTRLADGEPLALDTAWLPLDIAAPLLDADFTHTALYDELERRCGISPEEGWERISPILPSPEARTCLKMRRGEAAFFLERLSQARGRPVEWRTTILRGSRYRFVTNFRAGSRTSLAASVEA